MENAILGSIINFYGMVKGGLEDHKTKIFIEVKRVMVQEKLFEIMLV